MADNGDFPPINLETGNWTPPEEWTGRVRGWRLLKWILWDPYALRAYAGLYVQGKRAQLVSFLGDVAWLIFGVWLALSLSFIVLGMWWLSPLTLLYSVIGSGLLCLLVGGSFLLILGWDVDNPVAASIWAFVCGIGAALLYWSEVIFREGTPQLGILLYWMFVTVFGLLMGVVINSILHGIMRRRASRLSMIFVKYLGVAFYICGLTIYLAMLCNWILRSWVPFTISFWPLLIGLVLSLLAIWIGYRRIDDWLWGLDIPQEPPPSGGWRVPRVTTAPPPRVRSKLEYWFADGRSSAVSNINQFWRFTNLRDAIHALMETDAGVGDDNDVVVRNVSSLERKQYGWRLTDLFPSIIAEGGSWRERFLRWWTRETSGVESSNPYLRYAQDFAVIGDGPLWVKTGGFGSRSSRAAAGFAQMERWKFESAAKIFDSIRDSDSAAELAQLARALHEFYGVEGRLAAPVYPALTPPPTVSKRGSLWEVIRKLDEGLFYLWLRRHTRKVNVGPELVSAARERFDAIAGANLLEPEASLLRAMVERWRAELNVLVRNRAVDSSQVPNPYRPALMMPGGPSYIDRNELTSVQDALLYSPVPPIIVLTGLPGTGVSTLLSALNTRLPMALLSLTDLKDQANPGGDLLRLLAQEVARQTNQSIPANFFADNWRQTFQDYFFDVVDSLGGQLTIAIDDLELAASMAIDGLSLGPAISFIAKYLVGKVDGVSLILAGHFTPREVAALNGDQAISLDSFDEEAVGALLADPVWKTVLYYRPQTLRRIQNQTGGHPTLVRLLGAALVTRYNRPDLRDPVFSVEDVDVVIQNRLFKNQIERTVFRTMVGTVQRVDKLADALLSKIAQYPNTRTDDDLASLMDRQYGATAERVQRMLRDFDTLGLITRGTPRNGQETWRMTIPLFQDYLRSR